MTEKAGIRVDKGVITLRSGKNRVNFHKILDFLCKIKEEAENDIDPVTPTSTVSKLILEWEERIKLHQEKEMKFNEWRSKVFKDKRSTLMKEGCEVSEEEGVTYIFDEKNLEFLEFHM
ncbi:hypothetical protein Tco_0401032 [Tanacetum coccineum]